VINCPADSSVTIIFDELDTEFEKNCEYDYVAVSGVAPLTTKYCDYTSYDYKESNKKTEHLTFDHNVGKYRLILKILSLVVSQ